MKDIFFVEIAQAAAKQSACMRRKFGSVIVDPRTRTVVSTGFNSPPCGMEHCDDKGWCLREELNIPRGDDYSYCNSIHSEQNALIQAGRVANNCDIYISGYDAKTLVPVTMPKPCFLCTKMLINAHISHCYVWTGKNLVEVNLHELYNEYVKEIAKKYIMISTTTK